MLQETLSSFYAVSSVIAFSRCPSVTQPRSEAARRAAQLAMSDDDDGSLDVGLLSLNPSDE